MGRKCASSAPKVSAGKRPDRTTPELLPVLKEPLLYSQHRVLSTLSIANSVTPFPRLERLHAL